MQYFRDIKTGKTFIVQNGYVREGPIPSGASMSQGNFTLEGIAQQYGYKVGTPVTQTTTQTSGTGTTPPVDTTDAKAQQRTTLADGTIVDGYGRVIQYPSISNRYGYYRDLVTKGIITPQQALNEIQKEYSSGKWSGVINAQEIFPQGVPGATTQDTEDLQKVMQGTGQAGNYGRTPGGIVDLRTGQIVDLNSVMGNFVYSTLEGALAGGQTINPNIDLRSVDFNQFLSQAESSISPYYKQKFDVIKTELQRSLQQLGVDVKLEEEVLKRQAEKQQIEAGEEYAGRGLTFSSQADRFGRELGEELERETTRRRELAFRKAQQTLSGAEQLTGTSFLRGLPTEVAGRQLEFSGTPLTGELSYQQSQDVISRARALASDENLRRQEAYNRFTRSLSFA